MGLVDTFIKSTVSVIAGLVGLALLFAGVIVYAEGSGIGALSALFGVILLVFAQKV